MGAIKHLKGLLNFYLKEGKTQQQQKKPQPPKTHTQNTTRNKTQYFAAERTAVVTAPIHLHENWVANSLRQ